MLLLHRALAFRASIGSARTVAPAFSSLTTTTKMTEAAPSPFANPALDVTVGRPPPPISTSTARTFVLFHSPCPDGAFAALAAWLHFRGGEEEPEQEEKVVFVPHRVYETMEVPSTASPTPASSSPTATPTSPLSSLSAGDTVYLLDYSGPAGFPQALSKVAKRVVVLDHHKTAAEQLGGVIEGKAWMPKEQEQEQEEEEKEKTEGGGEEGLEGLRNLEVLIDQDRSGATIAVAHFNPSLTPGLSKAFAAIQDGDLWRWRLPDSKAFYAGLHSSGILDERVTRTPREMLRKLSELNWGETVERGAGEVAERDRAVAAEADRAFEVELRGPAAAAAAAGGASSPSAGVSFGRALAVEVEPEQAGLRSLLGNVLAARAKEWKEKEKEEGKGGAGMRSVGVVAYREPGMMKSESSPSDEGESLIKVSLRSIGNDEDTTPVSQAHGGGGHRNASSFLMPAREFASWKV